MPRFIVNLFKFIAIVFAPIAVIGFVVSKREISGNQYAAVLEVFGNGSVPGAIQIFGADIHTISSLLDFLGTWSLPVLIATAILGITGLVFSSERLVSTWHICLGMFFSFGVWAIFLSRSREAFAEFVGANISELSAQVIAAYLSELSAALLNLTGLLALLFGFLSFAFWVLAKRRTARSPKALN